MFDDPISSYELLEAAREYAIAVALAKDTAAASREADTRLTEADIAAAEQALGEAEDAEAPPGLTANAAPQDWCDPDSSEEELGLDMEYMESYGRVEQRRQHLARDASHDDGRAAA